MVRSSDFTETSISKVDAGLWFEKGPGLEKGLELEKELELEKGAMNSPCNTSSRRPMRQRNAQ